MPKINSGGVPSYGGAGEEVGVVTNAVGEQFDLADPTGTDEGQPVDEPADDPVPKKSTAKAAKK